MESAEKFDSLIEIIDRFFQRILGQDPALAAQLLAETLWSGIEC